MPKEKFLKRFWMINGNQNGAKKRLLITRKTSKGGKLYRSAQVGWVTNQNELGWKWVKFVVRIEMDWVEPQTLFGPLFFYIIVTD